MGAAARRIRRWPLSPEAEALATRLAATPLVDGHCHSIRHDWRTVGADAPAWRRCFTEATDPRSLANDVPATGGYREFLAAFAGYLGMERASDEAAVARERDRRAAEDGYLPRLLADGGIGELLVDTGYGGEAVLSTADLAKAAAVEVHTIVRVEQLAERVLGDARASASPTRLAEAVTRAIDEATNEGAAGLKTIAAYRSGLELPEPSTNAVRRALAHRSTQARRISDPALEAVVVRAAAEVGAERGLPLQVHTGFGDADLHLPTADPGLLGPLFADARVAACPVVLLHCYPFVRQAAYLASIHPNVHVDLSLTIPLLGAAGARAALAEALELCPTTKLLAGTDGHSYPEMHWRGATLWRESLAAVLGAEIADGRLAEDEAVLIGTGVLAANARRLYRLDASGL